jgi:hypothetical protein
MVSASVCHLVGPGFHSWPGTLGVPLLSNTDEEKWSSLRTSVHIQCGVTRKFYKSPQKYK